MKLRYSPSSLSRIKLFDQEQLLLMRLQLSSRMRVTSVQPHSISGICLVRKLCVIRARALVAEWSRAVA